MKKSTFITTAAFAFTVLLSTNATAQKFPALDKSIMDVAGANEATEITLYVDMKLDGKTVKAGTYTLYAIPGKDNYTIIINKDLNVWGSYYYKEANDVARISVPVTTATDSLEALSMVFTPSDNGVVLNMGWDKVRVAVPFTK